MHEPIPDAQDEPTPVVRAVDLGTARLLPDLDRPRAWLLTVDGAPQSHLDLDDPGHLEFEYARRLAHVLDVAAPPGAPLDVLHLGGGAFTLPRYAAWRRPGSRQRVAEVDGGLVELVTERLPLPAGSGIEVAVEDAGALLAAAPTDSADVVLADVFRGSRIPAHLTGVGHVAEAARVLRPGGSYAANLADSAPLDFTRAQLATLRVHFAELCLIAEPAVLRGRRFGNVVLVASDAPLPVAELTRGAAADPFPARVVHGAELTRLIGDAEPVRAAAGLPSPRPPSGAFDLA
ncbi:spermidine synthase [Streptomyces sp. NPDC127098]|uniref:spermidine synthase n=1 Tax=Streptomyces sp. NPDC127098 TaxID=3347137 RepID=UPI0036537B49